MEQHYITVENIASQDLEICLMDLANLYAQTDFVNGLQLRKRKGYKDTFFIEFLNQPDFERFVFFVNYLHYPEHLHTNDQVVRGYFNTEGFNVKHEYNYGEWLMIYVSKTDKNFDNVNIVNCNNQSFILDFGGRIKKLKECPTPFFKSEIIKSQYELIISIAPTKVIETSDTTPWWKFWASTQ